MQKMVVLVFTSVLVTKLVEQLKTAKTLKYILDTKNINVFEDRLFFSSSMDFADEYGFATHDGAKEIFYTAQRMIQDEIVANGQFACDFDG